MWKFILILGVSANLYATDFNKDLSDFLGKVEKQNSRQEIKNLVETFQVSLKKLEGTKNDPDDAISLRFALDLTLTVQTFTTEECLSAKIAHFRNFGVQSEDLLNPSDLPKMVRISYGILNRMCKLKD